MVVAGVLLLAAVVVVSAVVTTDDEEAGGPPPRPPAPFSCSSTDRSSIIDALTDGYARDVAAKVARLRCSATFAYGEVCILCATPPPGAIFGVLLARASDGSWRYLGSGGPELVERLADEAGLPRAQLEELRVTPTR